MVSDSIVERIEENGRGSFSGLYPPNYDFKKMAMELVDEMRVTEELERLSTVLSIDLRGKKFL